MRRAAFLAITLVILAIVPFSYKNSAVISVGSKKFTESVILSEILVQLARNDKLPAKHQQELGGTRLAFNSLVNGDIDAYPEYTGTIQQEILTDQPTTSREEISAALAKQGILVSPPLGFNNSYAMAMLKDRAKELGIERISDLARHPDLRLGLTSEFMDRGDGWPVLSRHYGFQFENVRGLDHDIAYRQLTGKAIDVMDVYSTDAKIKTLDLKVLEDDRQFFPRYDAVILYREDLESRFPRFATRLKNLNNILSESRMIELNHQTEVNGVPESLVAANFLNEDLGIEIEIQRVTLLGNILRTTLEHLDLVRKSLIPGILVGIPLGVLAAKQRRLGSLILNIVSIIQTIPALALLVMLMPVVNRLGGQSVGVGSWTAVTALFLYSLLPIVRNTFTGLSTIEPQYAESAKAMGLSTRFQLWNIELPLATRDILSGIKTAAVINVGFATLGALVGAGGYGQPILTGIRLVDTELVLQGAVPAAIMAVGVQYLFDCIERWIVPRGLFVE